MSNKNKKESTSGGYKCYICECFTFGPPAKRTDKGKPVCKYCLEKGNNPK